MRWGLFALPVLLSALIAGCSGCTDSSEPTLPDDSGGATPFDLAIGRLHQAEFPSREMLDQIVVQLNQWVSTQKLQDDWKLDPLVATLPPRLAEMPAVSALDQPQFVRSDGVALQEAIWLRYVSKWARGNQLDELSQARQLFDWTVRNIQLEDPQARQRLAQMPGETLLLGRGSAVERAWVFILLARQQGLDAAILALADPVDPAGTPPRPWTTGLLIGGDVYLFDPGLGMPLPAPDGVRLDGAGSLEIRPATLAQLAADDSLLHRLDLDQQRLYAVSSSDLDRVVALVEASPAYLARRMKLVESRLVGARSAVLSTSATAQVDRWKAAPQIADARLWTFPYEVLLDYVLLERQDPTPEQLQQLIPDLRPFSVAYAAPAQDDGSLRYRLGQVNPFFIPPPSPGEVDPFYVPRGTPLRKGMNRAPLGRARVLHLKGVFVGEQGATRLYQEARPSDEQLANMAEDYYRIALKDVERLPQEQRQAARQQLKQVTAQRARIEEPLLRRAKQAASYWLGLVNFDLAQLELGQKDPDAAAKHFQTAIDYLRTRTLEASPDGPWTEGADYNLARCYEATGQYRQAITRYASHPNSPSHHGNMLRARWLNELRRDAEDERSEAGDEESGGKE
jgi:hypothetical protein